MTSLKFGTSGLRGLVVDLEGAPARDWTRAFLSHVLAGNRDVPRRLLVGHDLRASSSGIARDCMKAASVLGFTPIDCGSLPTPALALESGRRQCPAIMVTGSHIPDDRNGLKFYAPTGEITKADEAGILAAFEVGGARDWDAGEANPAENGAANALLRYRDRYLGFFAPDALAGMTVGVYQHSSVARDLLVDLVESLGATVVPLGRSERFVPVDTEAHRPEDVERIAEWAADGGLDAVVSTDGDADRPLIAGETGRIVRGDLVGLLTAKRLALRTVVTPVTSSSAMERSGVAGEVIRTRVGSPYVIAAMGAHAPAGGIIGFEANGGVLLGSPVEEGGRGLAPLMTRDAVLPILCVLSLARREGVPLSRLVANLKAGHALADRLREVPATASAPFLARLGEDQAFAERFFATAGRINSIGRLDGVRVVLEDGASVHFRASGNAPELRCYVEAESDARASELLDWGLRSAESALRM